VDYDDPTYDEQTTSNFDLYNFKNSFAPFVIRNNFNAASQFESYVNKNFENLNDEATARTFETFIDLASHVNLIKFSMQIHDEFATLAERLNDNFAQNSAAFAISPNEIITTDFTKVDVNFNRDNRMEENLKLRSTARNSIVTYNATQRVFTPRLGEDRSSARFSDLVNTFQRQPFLGAQRISYERLLGKNKHNFFTAQLFKATPQLNPNIFSNTTRVTGFPCFEFPFLIGRISPASKHI
jgi:predicted ATP-dependent protease